MTSSTAAGSSLAISAASPATQDAAGFGALTFTEVGQVEKIGTFGTTYAKTEFQPFVGPKQKYKGALDYGALQPSLAHDESDAGQAIVRTAADDGSVKLYSFQVTYPTGAKRYFQGRVFGYPETADGADTILTAAPVVEICTAIVKVAPVTPVSPVNTVAPAITPATGDVGTVFTLSNGTWTNSPTFARQWYNSAGAISGATGTTYTGATGDRAGSIYGIVTATANGVPVGVASNSVSIPAAPGATVPGAPVIAATPVPSGATAPGAPVIAAA